MALELNFLDQMVTLEAVHGDITSFESGAIVNSANTTMVLGGRVSVASRINQLTEGRLEKELANQERFPKPVPFGKSVSPGVMSFPASTCFIFAPMGPWKK